MQAEQFEPVYLEIGDTRITDHGKRWLDRRHAFISEFGAILRDIQRLAHAERGSWRRIQRLLDLEGVPQAISSGVSQYEMQQLINASTKQAVYTVPTVFVMALTTAAPVASWTGTLNSQESAYTNYARTATTMGAATNAATSTATNSGTVTFPNCGATGSTLLGFAMMDNATVGSGNLLWYGTLTSTVISSTQTPPTVAAGALSLSMTGT